MKKVKYLIITCLSVAILSYGVIAFANGGTSVDSKNLSHGDVTGIYVAMIDGNSTIKLTLENGTASYPLEKSFWVFRDQKKTALENLKSGDKIELILSSTKKVAYIKAFSEVYLKAEAAATVSASPTATATAEPTPNVTPKPTAAPTPTMKPEPSPTITSNEKTQFIIVKEDSRVVVEKKEHKITKHHENYNDDDNHYDDNNHNDDNDHHGRNKHGGHGGEED
jgi:hypothetical protein